MGCLCRCNKYPSLFLSGRSEGEDGEVGEEEDGREGQADPVGGVPAEEERQED